MPRFTRDTGWFKSSKSAAASDNCVEVRLLDSTVRVRDSKAPDDGVLSFGSGAWGSFLASLKA
ncbi:protein of unknown function [Saccharopolyspora antimicrobica]|uniref:Uncharacterized protein DUF397 n=1 Tax=Saccharopolyspora antimicrobica TaxID=455193 RepID=A0A1I4SJ20_9PSEU|nr:DUF397 domain-containing protein [Saccharopolyspora antimicrobica]RKT87767.1 uncharacterized protein DUF397 [Saccharopolyspora antimicrobica]SFM64508.1 protein of unknown function [Saccharopolyspora antimicrobica]